MAHFDFRLAMSLCTVPRRMLTIEGRMKHQYSTAIMDVVSSSKQKLRHYSEIPGPRSLPLIKASWSVAPFIGSYKFDKLETSYWKLHDDFGPIVRLEFAGVPPLIFVFDRELIEQIYKEEGSTPCRPGLTSLLKYRESKSQNYKHKGLLVSQGEEWRNLRRIAQIPLLRSEYVRSYVSSMDNVSNDFIKRLRHIRDKRMEVQNVLHELYRWALESVGVFALDKRLGCLDSNLAKHSTPQCLINAVNDTLKYLYEMEYSFSWKSVFLKKNVYENFSKAQDHFTDIACSYLMETLNEIRTRGPRKKEGSINVLDSFLLETKMDLKHVKAIIFDLFFAGIDTTSSTMAFALYNLACRKDKREKLYDEISEIIPSKDLSITAEQLDKMPYLHAFLNETLRLYPVSLGTGRILERDIILGDYHIPRGMTLVSITSRTSRLEKYFERPHEFLPERWLRPDSSKQIEARRNAGLSVEYEPPRFAYLPFSYGPRMCIGRRFAEQQIHMALIKILQNFQLDYRHSPIKVQPGVANVPDRPLHIVFEDRTK